MTLKELTEQRAAHIAQMRVFNNANPKMTAEQEVQWDAMLADDKKIEASIEREKKLGNAEAQMNAHQPVRLPDIDPSAPQQETDKSAQAAAEDRAFRNWMLVGIQELSPEDRAIMQQRKSRFAQQRVVNDPKMALTTSTGAGGEFLVPTGFSNKLEIAEKYYGGIMQVATIMPTETGNPIPYPLMNDTGQMATLLGVNQPAQEADPGFNNLIFNAYKFTSGMVQVPAELIQDAFTDIGTLLANAFGERFGRAYNHYGTIGTGNQQPTGVSTAAPVGITLPAGNTTSLTFDNFFDLEYSVDLAYRSRSTYMLNDQAVRLIRKLKDAYGQYLWAPAAGDTPATIGGRPYITNNDMPVPAANAASVLLGDFSKFIIRKVVGYTLLRLNERYAEYDQIGFISFTRWDSQLLNAGTNPVVSLNQSAS